MSGSQKSLDVLVVGAGLGGLAAALALQTDGHKVTILEAAESFGEVCLHKSINCDSRRVIIPESQVGAGIHLPPNSSRLLLRWGVDLSKPQTISNKYHFIRYADGATIAKIPLDDAMETHGAPYHLVHRADLHLALLDAARRAGVQVLSNKRVVDYNFDAPTATTAEGETFGADLLIAADGIKSFTRPLITGNADKPRDTGDVAYRILLPGETLRQDPELSGLLDDPCITSWCGPGAHFIGYPIREGELYNVVICSTTYSEMTDEAWVVEGDNRELQERFSSWEPRVTKLCSLAQNFMKWRLCDVPNVSTWVHPSGKACLLGDSCHPMLPYLAQGATQAFEDAASLRRCLADSDDIKTALRRYQDIRMPRVTLVQAKTREHQYIWHVADGKEQLARDGLMGKDADENPVFWGHTERQKWLFGHDAEILDKEGANWLRYGRK